MSHRQAPPSPDTPNTGRALSVDPVAVERPSLPAARTRAELVRTGVGLANFAIVAVLLLREFAVF